MANLGDANTGKMEAVDRVMRRQWAVVDIGATGAPTINKSSSGFGITRAGAGDYDLTFKPMVYGLDPNVVIKSAALTVKGYVVTAFDPAAGTASIVTLAGNDTVDGTANAGDPANGDRLTITVDGMPYSDG